LAPSDPWTPTAIFTGAPRESDPHVGSRPCTGTIPHRPIHRRLPNIPPFVITRGGEYCFAPGARGCSSSTASRSVCFPAAGSGRELITTCLAFACRPRHPVDDAADAGDTATATATEPAAWSLRWSKLRASVGSGDRVARSVQDQLE